MAKWLGPPKVWTVYWTAGSGSTGVMYFRNPHEMFKTIHSFRHGVSHWIAKGYHA
jgi:hypothetical protein